MISETLLQVKKKIEVADGIDGKKKQELIELLSRLQSEIEQLAETNHEHAESIAVFAQASAHEALRTQRQARLHQLSLDGLASAVKGIEASHPELVKIVNAISLALSNLGI